LRQQKGLAGRRKTSTPRVSFADTRRAYIHVTDNKYGALLRQVTNFAGVQLLVLANQGIPFYIESPITKNCSDATGNFKN
jgi:hypothetical protein